MILDVAEISRELHQVCHIGDDGNRPTILLHPFKVFANLRISLQVVAI
jgi:hypothetical protein